MPATHTVSVAKTQCTVHKNGVTSEAEVEDRRPGEVYVHYLGTDRRMDEWVSESHCTIREQEGDLLVAGTSRKRKRGKGNELSASGPVASTSRNGVAMLEGTESRQHQSVQENGSLRTEVVLTEEELEMRHQKQLNAQRNFDLIIFDVYKIKPWYYSPYPLTESETEEPLSASQAFQKIPGVARATARSHGRTSDMLAGGLARQNSGDSTLWVCNFCFKYMVDGVQWEKHKKDCKLKHPPGRKVYQRGAHTIWEVDGAKEKLYTQNLALFGKLFIDVKTLFFDCDHFLFYILTDANSAEDHILGFFSKEKVSYDDYNLACIMTLPQYQRKGYGMLMIEFSYELSRRAGKVGTPERPLSDLGLRSYLAFWTSTLIRFFRRVLTVLPPGVVVVRNQNAFPTIGDDMWDITGEVQRVSVKRRKKSKGFDGEVHEADVNVEANMCMMPMREINDKTFTTHRTFETTINEDGGADTHVKVECTLREIAKATNLRIDDAAFALNECGLLMRRMTQVEEGGSGTGSGDSEESGSDTVVVITRSLVEKVSKAREIKKMYMDLNCVLP